MQRFKKTMKLAALGVLIVLATLGVGIGGGMPVPSNKKREESNEIKTELVENKDDETKLEEIKAFKL